MDLWSVVRVAFLRRWYASLPVLVLAVLCAVVLGNNVAPTFAASSKSVLRVPNTSTASDGTPVTVNPYLGFSGSLTTTSNVLSRILDGETVRAAIAAQELSHDYEVLAEQQYPMVTVSVEDPDSTVALLTVQSVAKVAQEQLDLLQEQAGAPAGTRIGYEVVSQYVAPLPPARSRLVVLTMGLGAALALLAGLLAEAAAVRRAGRGSQQDPDGPPAPPDSDDLRERRPGVFRGRGGGAHARPERVAEPEPVATR